MFTRRPRLSADRPLPVHLWSLQQQVADTRTDSVFVRVTAVCVCVFLLTDSILGGGLPTPLWSAGFQPSTRTDSGSRRDGTQVGSMAASDCLR